MCNHSHQAFILFMCTEKKNPNKNLKFEYNKSKKLVKVGLKPFGENQFYAKCFCDAKRKPYLHFLLSCLFYNWEHFLESIFYAQGPFLN